MIDKILKYRTSLMGFSILWIFINHLAFFGYLGNSKIINSFLFIGSCGVEIFMLLSSMGLYLSLQKENSTLFFYKKRLNRILPCFILLYPLWIYTQNNIDIFKYLTSMWFILGILVFYFIYPLFYKRVTTNNNKNIYLIISVGLSIFLTYLLYLKGWSWVYGTFMCTVQRIPIFITGTLLLLGARFPNYIYKSHVIFFLSFGLAYFVHFKSELLLLRYFSFYFLSISLIKYLILIFEHYKVLDRIMYFLGKYTLEIYLVHMLIMPVMRNFIPNLTNFQAIVIVTLVTIIGVYFTNCILKIYYKYIKL